MITSIAYAISIAVYDCFKWALYYYTRFQLVCPSLSSAVNAIRTEDVFPEPPNLHMRGRESKECKESRESKDIESVRSGRKKNVVTCV